MTPETEPDPADSEETTKAAPLQYTVRGGYKVPVSTEALAQPLLYVKPRKLNRRFKEPLRLSVDQAIHDGLPVKILEDLKEAGYGNAVYEWVVPVKTYARRKKAGRLSVYEGEKAARLHRLHSLALEVLGTKKRALEWMQKPRKRFGGRSAFDLSETEVGGQEVEEALIQLAEGIFI